MESLLKIIFKILFDHNFTCKGNNIDIIIKDNIKHFFINNYPLLKDKEQINIEEINKIIDKSFIFILEVLNYNYEELQNWSLSWINHLYEFKEVKITKVFYKIFNKIIIFYSNCDNEYTFNTIYLLIDKLKNKFLYSNEIKIFENNLKMIKSISVGFKNLNEEKIIYILDLQKCLIELFFNNLLKISIYNKDNLGNLDIIKVINILIFDMINWFNLDDMKINNLVSNLNNYLISNINNYILKLNSYNLDSKPWIEELLNNLIEFLNSPNELIIKISLKWLDKLIDITNIYNILSFKKLYLNILSPDKEILENTVKIISKIIIKNDSYHLLNEMFIFLLNSEKDINFILKSIFNSLKYLFTFINNLYFLKKLLKEINLIKELEIKKKIIKNIIVIIFFDKSGEFYKNKIKSIDLNNETDFKLYYKIYKTFNIDLICSTYLCLLKRHYSIALKNFVEINNKGINTNDLINISKFVKILEQPYFTYLRIDMLNKELNNDLLKFFDLILIILPQGEPFKILKSRLKIYIMFENIDLTDNDDSYRNLILNIKDNEKKWKKILLEKSKNK